MRTGRWLAGAMLVGTLAVSWGAEQPAAFAQIAVSQVGPSCARGYITWDRAAECAGSTLWVVGPMTNDATRGRADGQATVLRLGHDSSEARSVAVIIPNEDRAKFDQPARPYVGQVVCVYGTIMTADGPPRIVTLEPRQVKSCQ